MSAFDFVGPDAKRMQLVNAEGGGEGHVGRIAPARHQYPTDAWHVVAGIKGVPLAAEVRLEPGAEVHWSIGWRHADVAQVPCAVASGDIAVAAKGDRQMHV